MIGIPLTGRADANTSPNLLTTLQRAGAQHSQRATSVASFIFVQTLLLVALCIPWIQRRIVRGRWWWVLPYASGAAALAIVLAPAFGSPALGIALATVALIALGAAIVLAAVRDRVLALGLLATATAGALALDLAFGAPLARWSFLGYDLVVGGRFYGVGNEYEGVLIGASIVGAACLVVALGPSPPVRGGRGGRWAASHSSACSRCRGSAPMRAARWRRPSVSARPSTASRAAASRGAGRSCSRACSSRSASRASCSQASSAARRTRTSDASSSRLARGDLSFASALVLGKLRANAFLLGSSPWRSVLLAAAAALTVLGVRYRAEMRTAYVIAPDLARGIPGLIAGGIAVLLLNDSGVIALATLAPFAVLLVLTLIALATHAPAEEPAP